MKVNPQNIDNTKSVLPTNCPSFTAAVNRKLNIGNFESVDLAASITLPMLEALDADLEILRQIVKDTAAEAFALVSEEVNQRATMIKEMRSTNQRAQTP